MRLSRTQRQRQRRVESVNNIYISGYQPGPKIQASYAHEGPYQYPSNGLRQIQFETNREYEFMIRVRDNLVNAYLDGELMLTLAESAYAT